MPEQEQIYQSQADGYDRLIQHEDYRGNLLPALETIVPLRGTEVIDIGSGTGRFPRMLSAIARSVVGLDRSMAMLQVARSTLQGAGADAWRLVVGENRALPICPEAADVVLAGWTFGHATVWTEDRWREEIDPAVREMMRLLRPGGTAIICETLGTGSLHPAPPTPTLEAYYQFLESEWSFVRRVVRTDYQFATLEESVETIQFFFGAELAEHVRKNRWTIVPEWTGIWWRHKEAGRPTTRNRGA